MADLFKFWRYPVNFDPEEYNKKLLNRLYWNYKNNKPVIRAEKNSGLEDYFTEISTKFKSTSLPPKFKSDTCLKISAVGDLMHTKHLENSMGKFYAKVSDLIFNADLSIANLESALTSANVNRVDYIHRVPGSNLQASNEQFDAFKGHKNKKYDVFCTANNHILDRGMEGFTTTHEKLKMEDIYHVGTNLSFDGQNKGLILYRKGVKFGLIAATYGLNGRSIRPGIEKYLVNVVPFHAFKGKVDLSLLEKQISFCMSEDCDFIILSLHWGMEFEFYPRKDQVDIAHYLIEYGADAIFSHHTHNIQPYEFYQTIRDPHRKAPIFYGLGNLSSISNSPHRLLSLIANFEVVKGRVNGVKKTLVKNVEATPVLQVEYNSNDSPYIQLEKLKNMINNDSLESQRNLFKISCYLSDLVLGTNWRKL